MHLSNDNLLKNRNFRSETVPLRHLQEQKPQTKWDLSSRFQTSVDSSFQKFPLKELKFLGSTCTALKTASTKHCMKHKTQLFFAELKSHKQNQNTQLHTYQILKKHAQRRFCHHPNWPFQIGAANHKRLRLSYSDFQKCLVHVKGNQH